LLFYRHYKATPISEKFIVVVVKVRDEEGTILTAYFTDKVKRGELVWKR
jgi:hypothetical protein